MSDTAAQLAALHNEVTALRQRRDGLLEAMNQELEKRRSITRAARALYEAGRWTLADGHLFELAQAKLWQDLRDALGLQPGTATALGAGADAPPAFFHDFFRTGDADAPDALKDRNGVVVLNECRVCGQAEGDLTATCPGAPTSSN